MAIFSFIGFTALVAIVSYFATKGTDETSSDGYFLGGRSLTAGVIAGSLLLTNLSTEQIVGLNGQAYSEGILVMAWETLAAIAMVVTAMFLLPRYLKSGLTTVPQFLEDRYSTLTKTITSALFLSGYVVVLLPIVLYSGSLAIVTMFDVPGNFGVSHTQALWMCVWGIGLIGSVYAIFGGLKAVAVSDTINAIGLLVGGLLIPYFGLKYIGDGSLSAGFSTLVANNPHKFESIGGPTATVPFSTIFTGMMLVQLFYWGTNQAIIQRALAAKNLNEGQKGLYLAAFFKILGPLIVVLPGVIAYHIFEGNLEIPDQAYPLLVKKVLPTALIGFFAAVLFGAILSSFNSALNSSVTLFGLDIYKEYINPTADEKTIVKYGKAFGIFLALLSMFIAPLIANAPDGLFGYLQEINGCYSIPILTIIVVGYLNKRVPAVAANIGLLSGVILYAISQFGLQPHFINKAIAESKEKGITEMVTQKMTSAAMLSLAENPNLVPTDLASAQKIVQTATRKLTNQLDDSVFFLTKETTESWPNAAPAPQNGIVNPLIMEAATMRANEAAKRYAGKSAYPHFLHVMAILFLLNVCIMLLIGMIKPRDTDFVLPDSKKVAMEPYKFLYPVGIGIIVTVMCIYWYFA